MCLAENQTCLDVIATEKEDLNTCLLHPRYKHGVVRFSWREDLIDGRLKTAHFHPSSDPIGDAGTPGRTIIQDRYFFACPMVGEIVGDHGALSVVAPAHAEHVPTPFVGQLRAGRARGNLKNACLLVDFRSWNRSVRAPMGGDENHAIVRQFLRERHRLIGIAGIIAHNQLSPLAKDTAPPIEFFDCELSGPLVLFAGPSIHAGHRARSRDPNLSVHHLTTEHPNRSHTDKEQSPTEHGSALHQVNASYERHRRQCRQPKLAGVACNIEKQGLANPKPLRLTHITHFDLYGMILTPTGRRLYKRESGCR